MLRCEWDEGETHLHWDKILLSSFRTKQPVRVINSLLDRINKIFSATPIREEVEEPSRVDQIVLIMARHLATTAFTYSNGGEPTGPLFDGDIRMFLAEANKLAAELHDFKLENLDPSRSPFDPPPLMRECPPSPTRPDEMQEACAREVQHMARGVEASSMHHYYRAADRIRAVDRTDPLKPWSDHGKWVERRRPA